MGYIFGYVNLIFLAMKSKQIVGEQSFYELEAGFMK